MKHEDLWSSAARLCWQALWWLVVGPLIAWPLRFWQERLPFLRRHPQALALFLPCFFVLGCFVFAGLTVDTEQILALSENIDLGDPHDLPPLLRRNLPAKILTFLGRPASLATGAVAYLFGRPAAWAFAYVSYVTSRWLLFAPLYCAAAQFLHGAGWLRALPDGLRERRDVRDAG